MDDLFLLEGNYGKVVSKIWKGLVEELHHNYWDRSDHRDWFRGIFKESYNIDEGKVVIHILRNWHE